MSFYKEVPGRKTTLESVLKFDIAPTEGSTNPVTSDGVKVAIDGAVGDASAALQEQIDDIAEKAGSGYIPKGEADVATLNALSGQENGWLYTMTDAGTLTDGSLAVVAGDTVAWDETNSVWYKAMDYAPAQYGTNEVHNLPTTITAFRSGDVIPVDGPSGTAKMSKDTLLELTSFANKGQIFGAYLDNPESLNDLKDNKCYIVQRTVNTATTDFPSDYPLGGGTLVCMKGEYESGKYQVLQVLRKLSNDDSWYRTYNSSTSTWSAWIHAKALPDEVSYVSKNSIFANWSENLGNLNDALDNYSYLVQKTDNTTTLNLPSDLPNGMSVLSTFKSYYSNYDYQRLQVLRKLSNDDSWYRTYNSSTSTWGTWTHVPNDIPLPTNIAYVASKQIFDGWEQNLADLDNAEDNHTYIIQRTANTQTLNLPTEYVSGSAILQTYIAEYTNTATQKIQVLHKLGNGDWWYRSKIEYASWSAWIYVPGNSGSSSSGVIEIGPGKTYTTLRAGIAAAFLIKNCRVEIFPATYDLVDEFSDRISSSMTGAGLTIGNGMYLHFHQGAKVTAIFDENDYDATTWRRIYDYFEPFRLGGGDFTIENLDISAKDCRYCVHDEAASSQSPYTHRYINCVMQYENTHTTDLNYSQCIGGGLGKLGYIYIDGGRYKSITAAGFESVDGDASLSQRPISYHNSAATDCESAIYIRNVYLEDKGYFQIVDYGTSTKVTKVQIDSCSYEYPPLHTKVRNSGAPDNMDVIEWGNNKRTTKHWVVESDDYHAQLVDD